jgi:predicted nucleic acid-binding protein
MPRSVFHDSVSLIHFAVVERLDILRNRHAHLPEPRWCEAVKIEICDGANLGVVANTKILEEDWLGVPADISAKDRAAVYRIHVALNDGREPPIKHEGEAHSIFLSEQHDAIFFTDDNEAYDFALRRPNLGKGRVKDTVEVLRQSVAMGDLTKVEASALAKKIDEADRALRTEHRNKMTPDYFLL